MLTVYLLLGQRHPAWGQDLLDKDVLDMFQSLDNSRHDVAQTGSYNPNKVSVTLNIKPAMVVPVFVNLGGLMPLASRYALRPQRSN